MKDFQIVTVVKMAATYDEFDGFGDYVNYRNSPICTVTAANADHAVEVFRSQTTGLFSTIDVFAIEAK